MIRRSFNSLSRSKSSSQPVLAAPLQARRPGAPTVQAPTSVPARHQSQAAVAMKTSSEQLSELSMQELLAQAQQVAKRQQQFAAVSASMQPVTHTQQQQQPQAPALDNASIYEAVEKGHMRFFNLENELGRDYTRAVEARRYIVEQKTGRSLQSLAYQHYDYNAVWGQCCENVIGVAQLPIGVAGPLLVDGKEYYIPLATTEGALVASTTRGCKALSAAGGVSTELVGDGMSRAPVVQVANVTVAAQLKKFVEERFDVIQAAFNSTSRFARLQELKAYIAGRKVYLRFKCSTGDAMGMNMVSKGTEEALRVLGTHFPLQVLALSGNMCTDKKPSSINWTEGRGKSVVADCVIPASVVRSVLKTNVRALCELNYSKNLIGSALAGSIGGQNAHAANLVTAVFLATGQDPAQNVESSNCMTLMEPVWGRTATATTATRPAADAASTGASAGAGAVDGEGEPDLYISVNMPSIEVGTVGGGTSLPGQAACLELLGVRGANPTTPGANSRQLARLVAATVMAGELSLMSALSSGHLIKSHLALNRKPATPIAGAAH